MNIAHLQSRLAVTRLVSPVAALPLALAIGAVSPAQAQPPAHGAPVLKPQNKPKPARVTPLPARMVEDAVGKPLTEEQRAAIAEAAEAYNAAVAKAVGLTPEELKARIKANREKRAKEEQLAKKQKPSDAETAPKP